MTHCKKSGSAIAILFFIFCGELFASEKQILVIESYHSEYPWDASYLEALTKNLANYTITRFQMDTKRIAKSEFQNKADAAWKMYNDLKPDLVILGDDNAVKFLAPKLQKTNTPVVFLGVNNNPRNLGIMGAQNITGVLERPLFKRSIAELDALFSGNLQKVLILFDSGTTSEVAVAETFKGQSSLSIGKVQIELRLIGDKNEWERSVLDSNAEGFNAIVVGLYHTIIDANGDHVPADTILKWTSDHTPVPIFSFWDFSVGKDKTAGGLVLFGKVQGEVASKMVIDILEKGIQPSQISPQIADRGRYLYSRSQLDKWGLKPIGTMQERAEWVD